MATGDKLHRRIKAAVVAYLIQMQLASDTINIAERIGPGSDL